MLLLKALFSTLTVFTMSSFDNYEEGDVCQTRAVEKGICSRMENCPQKSKELAEKLVQGGRQTWQASLDECMCGMEGREPLICCESPTKKEVIEDVSQHPNIALLRPDICGPVTQDRIANGNKAKLFELPWMALLTHQTLNYFSRFCGGTVINERYVLTAAHCLHVEDSPNFVRLGEHDIGADVDCEEYFDGEKKTKMCAPRYQDIAVEEVIEHPDYVEEPYVYNDVALLRLSSPANFSSDAVRPICLPIGLSQQAQPLVERMVVVSGWGETKKELYSDKLLKVTVRVADNKECGFFPPLSPQTQICIKDSPNGGDVCEGDSGGPLTYIGEVEGSIRTIQHGVASNSIEGCGVVHDMSVFARVGYYMKWILDNMKP